MKVKRDSADISNRKKNALPSSKLLKPKKFKPLKKRGIDNELPLSSDKLKFVKKQISAQLEDNRDLKIQGKLSEKIKSSGVKGKPAHLSTRPNITKSKNSVNDSKAKNIPILFDFVESQKHKERENVGDRLEGINIIPRIDNKRTCSVKQNLTTNSKENQKKEKAIESEQNLKVKETVSQKQTRPKKKKVNNEHKSKSFDGKWEKKLKSLDDEQSSNPVQGIVCKDHKKRNEMPGIDKCNLKANKVAAITKGLLKLINESTSIKPEFLDVGEPVFLQLECIKIPICATKQLRFKLPHPLADETSDVLLITADLKGHKIYPDRAVDHYEELLAKLQINFITKVMPLRMIKKEYSQYEMKRKLVDQFDVILADSRIIKSLPAILGKFALYKRKMPIPVKLTIGDSKLKSHLQDAVCKTQMTVKSNGHSSAVQIGHTKMNAKEMAANIIEVAKMLEKLYPGGWRNIRSLVIKTTKSTSLPIYLSLLSPNEVKIPVEVPKKPMSVEDELSTMPGHNVIVTANGNVILKKVDEDVKIDNSRDDEILEEAEKYLESSKTVRYDESSDDEKNEQTDSDDEGEAITEAMEKKLMNKYEKNATAKKKHKSGEEEEEEDEEEEEESEEESERVPVIGKKRKSLGTKKQSGPPTKKPFNPIGSKGKNKIDKSNKENKAIASPGSNKLQTRGSRGGKKNKMSKDQRKALIKRKKAGKNK